jgi:hypothetical protein
MRKLREVMRLRFELHLGYQQIARSLLVAAREGAKMAAPGGATLPLVDGSGCARALPGRRGRLDRPRECRMQWAARGSHRRPSGRERQTG